MNAPALTRDQAWRIAWTRGGQYLERALMHSAQLDAFSTFRRCKSRRFVMLWTRRGGKSLGGVIHAMAECIARPGIDYKYAAPTQDMARSIVYPHAEDVLATCPDDLRPKVHRQSMTWTFRNGSVLKLAGCDGLNANRLRGTSLDEAFVDEAGFVSDLRDVVENVLMPQTITTGGRIIMASSPPITPAHPLASEYVPRALEEGAFVRRTIYEVPHIPREKADEYVAEAGGPESATARREYMAEIIVDESTAIVPEFQRLKDELVQTVDRPRWCDWYVSGDFGFSDLTVVLFAWYDFRSNRIVVEDEIVTRGESGLVVGTLVKDKERELRIEPRCRIADAPAQMLADLAHPTLGPGIAFGPAIKDDADAALNQLRSEVQLRRILIHPRCKTLIDHLTYGVWATEARTTFQRSPAFGHFDAIDALKYLLRVVDRRRNPTPDIAPETRREDLHMPPGAIKPRGWNAPATRARW